MEKQKFSAWNRLVRRYGLKPCVILPFRKAGRPVVLHPNFTSQEQKMNVKLAMAFGAALVAASTSFAQASEYQDFSNFVSTKSRADVISEQAAAHADGSTLSVLDGAYPAIARQPGAQRDRQQVVAELEQFRAQHPDFNAELDYPAVFQSASMQPRIAGMNISSAAR